MTIVPGVTYHRKPGDTAWKAPGREPLPAGTSNPVLPNLPTVEYTSLYRSGDSFQQALSRLTGYAMVSFPNGFDVEVSGFPSNQNYYGFYVPRLLGFAGPGKNQARIRLAPMSSTPDQRAQIPAQSTGGSNPLTIARFGNGPTDQRQMANWGFTIEGTNQAVSALNGGRPHNFSGINSYVLIDPLWYDVKVSGCAGDWNSPPGETFQFLAYKNVRPRFIQCEADGLNVTGDRVGGAPLGIINTEDSYLEDCFFHDSYVSALTYSFAGGPDSLAATSKGIHTKRVKVWNCANWVSGPGKDMAPFNHENIILKPILHEYPDIKVVAMPDWNNAHMAFNSKLGDNPDITIIEPEWHGQSSPRNNGCFTVHMGMTYAGVTQTQVTPPKVIKNGVQLQPYHIYGNPPSVIPVSPNTHFVVCH